MGRVEDGQMIGPKSTSLQGNLQRISKNSVEFQKTDKHQGFKKYFW